jgi:hypothetical protein
MDIQQELDMTPLTQPTAQHSLRVPKLGSDY